MKRQPPLKLEARDIEAAQELREALIEVEELPYNGRWEMALELLPDMFFYNFMTARDRKQPEQMNLYGPLALVAIDELLGEEPDTDLMVMVVYGIAISCVAELERRHKRFCTDVVFMDDLFDYDPVDPVKFVPKDPETFSIDEMIAYYLQLSREKLAVNA